MTDKPIYISKSTGEKEVFELEKLERSLQRAHASPGVISKVTSHIMRELEEGMSTQQIYDHAFEVLHVIEKGAALRYSLKRALLDLGPTGFPFEKFIAEIFKYQKYTTLTDQMVAGMCVEHEVDVVAWKDDNLIMSEVKFHNQLGLKSDLKVVLYVKSRFDDLAKAPHTYGGKHFTLAEGQLITNTKFTISAIKFAECQNMKIIGWNYPLDGNLQDLIEKAGLHPITSLRALSDHDKKDLLAKGIVLCKSLEDEQVRASLGLSAAHSEAILEEIHHLADKGV
jgi:hypothetical protein